ncbi:hypothetical protein ALQ45_03408 [Pseudomonas amygdali pv. morsprunorum]|nr:hypothetical protein ALQ45_03408 [Pseudomonas amygdali pv. morsprunorum]RMU35729.1 hypothetical protein ALP31_01521 [Pseudomonas amygdali pv. morsprunorum]
MVLAFCRKACFKVKKYHVRSRRFLVLIPLDCLADTFKFSMSKNILFKFFVTELSLLLFRPAHLATE